MSETKYFLFKAIYILVLTLTVIYFLDWHWTVCDVGINRGANLFSLYFFVLPFTLVCLTFLAFVFKSWNKFIFAGLFYILLLGVVDLWYTWDYPSPFCVNNIPWFKL